MRILWLSPWFRVAARIHSENLQKMGNEVMLVTATLHPESEGIRDYERELPGRPVPTAGWSAFARVFRECRRFRPELVVTEFLLDPRWRALARLGPRIRIIHDAAPHDSTHVLPLWHRLAFDRWDAAADATVVFSQYVAQVLRESNAVRTPIFVAPLTSDLPPDLIPEFVPPERRKNFVFIGRQRPYKNHAVVFDAWKSHILSSSWDGDELVILGDGEIAQPLPPHARRLYGSYRYRDVVPELAAAKGSIVHSRAASQSGVQVLSMQLGVPTLVSTAGALPEYQPPGMPVLGIDDSDGLAEAIGKLADQKVVEFQSELALQHYMRNYSSEIAARRLEEIFKDFISTPK